MQNPWDNDPIDGGSPSSPVVIGTPRAKDPPPVRPIVQETDEQQLRNARIAESNARLEGEAKQLANEKARREAALSPEGGKPNQIPPAAAAGIQENLKSLRAVEQALALLRRRPNSVGIGTGAFGDTFTQLNDPEGTEVRSAIANIGAVKIHDLSGAAVSPTEAPRFTPFVPTVTDRPDVAHRKLKQFHDTLRDQISEQLNYYGPANQYLPYRTPDAEQFQSAVTAQSQPQQQPPVNTDRQYHAELDAAFTAQGLTPDQRLAKVHEIEARYRRPVDPAGAQRQATQGIPGNYQDDQSLAEPTTLSQLLDSTKNTVAGIGQGIASLPDIATNALSGVMGLGARGVGSVADMLGMEGVADSARWTADQLAHPITIGGTIEKAAPTPTDGVGHGVRFASQLTGGVLGMPSKASTALVEGMAGKAPRPPMPPASGPSRGQIGEDLAALEIEAPAAVTGGPVARALSALMAQTPIGAGFANRAAGKLADTSSRALNNMAKAEGSAVNAESAGEAATRGALKYRSGSRTSIGATYDKAAAAAGDTRVLPDEAVQTLDQHIAELSENPAGAEGLTYLNGLRDTLVNKFKDGVTVQGVRGMRTQLRDKFYRDGLRGSDIERRVMQAVDSIGADLDNSLTAAGKTGASSLFREADAAWAERSRVLDDFIMPIIGKKGEKSGEQVFQAVQQAAKSNGKRLDTFLKALPAEDAGTARASMIKALGRSGDGAQSAAGDAFSLDSFLTRWNNMGKSARDALLTGENRVAIERLARVAEQSKAAGRYSGHSNSAAIGLAAGTVLSGAAGFATLGKTLAGEAAAGALLTSPRVAMILARIGGARTPSDVGAALKDLSGAAAKNPAMAGEIQRLQARLTQAFNGSPATAAAAQEDEQVR